MFLTSCLLALAGGIPSELQVLKEQVDHMAQKLSSSGEKAPREGEDEEEVYEEDFEAHDELDERRIAEQLLGLTGRNGSGGRAFEPTAGDDLMMALSSGLPKAGFGFSPSKPAVPEAPQQQAQAPLRAAQRSGGSLGAAERPPSAEPGGLKPLPKFRQGNAEPLKPSAGNKAAEHVALEAMSAAAEDGPFSDVADKQPSWKLSTRALSLKSAAAAQEAKAAATAALNATGGNAVRILRCSGHQINCNMDT